MSEEGGARTDPADRTEAAYETLLNARSIEIEGATLAKILLLLRKVVNSQSNALLLVGKAVTQELSGEDLRRSSEEISSSMSLIDDIAVELAREAKARDA